MLVDGKPNDLAFRLPFCVSQHILAVFYMKSCIADRLWRVVSLCGETCERSPFWCAERLSGRWRLRYTPVPHLYLRIFSFAGARNLKHSE